MLKMTIPMFVLYSGKIGAFVKTACLIQLKRAARQNEKKMHTKKQTNKQTNIVKDT